MEYVATKGFDIFVCRKGIRRDKHTGMPLDQAEPVSLNLLNGRLSHEGKVEQEVAATKRAQERELAYEGKRKPAKRTSYSRPGSIGSLFSASFIDALKAV